MKLKEVMIQCNEPEKLKKILYDKCIGYKYIIDTTDETDIKEIGIDKIKILELGNTLIIPLSEFCTLNDMLGLLKSHEIDGVITDNFISTYDEKYIGFKTLKELADFIIEKKQRFNFLESTAKELKGKYKNTPELLVKLFEISNDNKILPDSLAEIFIL